MSSKKIGDCIVHGLRLPGGCTTRRIRHPEIMYEPSSNTEKETMCLEKEYNEIPPVPIHKPPGNVCKPPKTGKRLCPPPTCICPPKPLPVPVKERLRQLFWILIKLGVFTGVVKVTDDLRIWSTSEETESLYHIVHEAISPAKPEGDIIPEPELPGMERVCYQISRKWNDGIIYMFSLFGLHPSAIRRRNNVHE